MRNKPVAHVKKGETLIFTSSDGEREFRQVVSRIDTVEYDQDMIKLVFPAVYEKTLEGKKYERSPKGSLVLHKNEQVFID